MRGSEIRSCVKTEVREGKKNATLFFVLFITVLNPLVNNI